MQTNVVSIGGMGNTFKGTMNFTETFTADNDAGTAAVSTVALVQGCGKESSNGLPAGLTITAGDHDVYAELQDSFQKTGIALTELILESDTVAHFTGTKKVTMYERPFNGRTPEKTEILLSKYKTSDGSGTNTTLNLVFDQPVMITPRTVIEIEVIKNSVLTVTGYYNFQENLRPIAVAG